MNRREADSWRSSCRFYPSSSSPFFAAVSRRRRAAQTRRPERYQAAGLHVSRPDVSVNFRKIEKKMKAKCNARFSACSCRSSHANNAGWLKNVNRYDAFTNFPNSATVRTVIWMPNGVRMAKASGVLFLAAMAISSSLSAAETGTVSRYTTEMECGGVKATLESVCKPEKDGRRLSGPFACHHQRIRINNNEINLEKISVINRKSLVASDWKCLSEKNKSAFFIYLYNGGNCRGCENELWISTDGHLLSSSRAKKIFGASPSVNAATEMNLPPVE